MSDTKSVTGQEIVEYRGEPQEPSGFWSHEKAWMDFTADMMTRKKQRVVSVVLLQDRGTLGVVYEDIARDGDEPCFYNPHVAQNT